MTPDYRLVADAVDVTDSFRGQLVQLTITDKQGTDSDELELTVTDRDGRIVLPRRGVKLRVWVGWRGSPLIDKGTYQVDEVEHSGPPDIVRIKGRAAELQGAIKEQRDTSYHGQTLGDILGQVAGRHGLTPAVDATLAATKIGHIDQTNESDLNFVTRLGKDYDAAASVKDGHLVFVPAGAGRSAAGVPLPVLTIARTATVSHSFTISDREGGDTAVQAQYRDKGAAETKAAVAGDGNAGTTKTLRRVYPTEGEAAAAATAAVTQAKRAQHELKLTLDHGRPELIAGQPIRLTGWRPEIDGVPWIVEDLTHTLDDSGLRTSLSAKGTAE